MKTGRPKATLALTDDERAKLQAWAKRPTTAQRLALRARIVLACAGGADNKAVARCFVAAGFRAALGPKPQPPRPDKIKIKGDLEQRLAQLACSEPPEGRGHWTLQLLADKLVVLGLVKSISTETIRQALKKTTFSRGLSKVGACRPRRTPNTSGEWKT